MGLSTEPIESSIPPGEPARRRFRVASAGSDRTHICPTVRGRLVQWAGSVGWVWFQPLRLIHLCKQILDGFTLTVFGDVKRAAFDVEGCSGANAHRCHDRGVQVHDADGIFCRN